MMMSRNTHGTTVLNLGGAMLAGSVLAALTLTVAGAAHGATGGAYGSHAATVAATRTLPDLPGIETTVHGVVLSSTLPHCANEDGSGSVLPCTWNVGAAPDGNGYGAAYVVRRVAGAHGHRPRVADYVWPYNPATRTWEWEGPASDCLTSRTHPGIERCPDDTHRTSGRTGGA